MEVEFKILKEKKLVGMHLTMTHAGNRTYELWNSFMSAKKEVSNLVGTDLISLQVYDDRYDFSILDMNTPFEKWAAVEVENFDFIPEGMEGMILQGGLYAVFVHKGSAQEGHRTFGYIFGEWLPNSAYQLDDRPHFEILGEKYKNDDPSSEEEIWIPVRSKN